MNDEFDDLEPLGEGPEPGEDAGPGDDLELNARLAEGATLRLNDTGNGRRFVLYFGDDLMFVPRVGWFVWDGRVWASDPDEIEVMRRSQGMSDLIEREKWFLTLPPAQMDAIARERALLDELGVVTRDLDDDGKLTPESERRAGLIRADLDEIKKFRKSLSDLRTAHRRFANTSGNGDRMRKMRIEAGTIIARRVEDLDAQPLDINTESGVLRFSVTREGRAKYSSFEVLPHDRALRMTKIAPVTYDPDAECPRFDAFFQRIQPDERMRRFLLRWFALSMTGLVEQKVAFFYGKGANGKSVLVDLMAKIAGDYAAVAKIESLTGSNRRGGGDATPDLVPLIGARMVRAAEPDEGVRWQEGLIKDLTGGEPIMVRALHSDFIEVRPFFTLTISGNHRPDIRGTDDGIWRRLLLVPFEEQIPKAEQIPKPELDAALFQERDGIFRRLVEALGEYLEIGLDEPEAVQAATDAFREESDPYGAFLDDACIVTGDPGDTVQARELVQAFHFWLMSRGEGAFKDRTVALALKDRARRWVSRKTGKRFTERKASIMCYDGIRFNDLFRRDWDLAPKDSSGRAIGLPQAASE